jgi:hypothetical protein
MPNGRIHQLFLHMFSMINIFGLASTAGPSHDLRMLMKKHRTAKQCARLILFFLKQLRQLKDNPLAPLKTRAKTLRSGAKRVDQQRT